MLPEKYTFQIYNDCGVTLAANAVKVFEVKWKIASGALVYSTETTVYNESDTTADLAYNTNATLQDNSTDLDFGAWYEFEVLFPTSPSGSVTLFLMPSVDGTTLPDDGQGIPIASLYSETTAETLTRMIEFTGT